MTPTPPQAAPSEARFFIDHDMIHDRETGRHVHGHRDFDIGTVDAALTMLNELDHDAKAFRAQTVARASQTVALSEPAAYLHKYRNKTGGTRYEQADLGGGHGPDPDEGFVWCGSDPLYTADQMQHRTSAAPAGAQPVQWPKARDLFLRDDMGQGQLRVLFDSDNDVIVSIWPTDGQMADIEFCNGGGGGGKSPETRNALIALMCAMERDGATEMPNDAALQPVAATTALKIPADRLPLPPEILVSAEHDVAVNYEPSRKAEVTRGAPTAVVQPQPQRQEDAK